MGEPRCSVGGWRSGNRNQRLTVCLVILLAPFSDPIVSAASATAPTWARAAVTLEPRCNQGGSSPAQQIPSPDEAVMIEVDCRRSTAADEGIVVRVTYPGGQSHTVSLEKSGYELWRPQELLWSPDSK